MSDLAWALVGLAGCALGLFVVLVSIVKTRQAEWHFGLRQEWEREDEQRRIDEQLRALGRHYPDMRQTLLVTDRGVFKLSPAQAEAMEKLQERLDREGNRRWHRDADGTPIFDD